MGDDVEKTDENFRASVIREIKEEVGDVSEIEITDFIGAFLETKWDTRTNKEMIWVFLVYQGDYIRGELQILEPEKCLGYEFYDYPAIPQTEVSAGCAFLNDYYYHMFLLQNSSTVDMLLTEEIEKESKYISS